MMKTSTLQVHADSIAWNSSLPSHVISVNLDETHGQWAEAFLAGQKLPVFVDISPDTSAANTGKLFALLKWLLPRSSRIVVVEGSFLARWDLIPIEDLNFEQARDKAARRADTAARRINAIIHQLNATESIQLLEWRAILEREEFKSTHSKIHAHFRESSAFAAEIQQTAEKFHERMIRRGHHTQRLDWSDYFTQYILEEVAGLIHLHVHEGIPVEIYPGSDLPVMRHIAEGGFDHFPIAIPQRTHVSLNLKPSPLRAARRDDWPALLKLIRQWPTHFVESAMSAIEADFRRTRTFVWEENGQIVGFMIWSTDGYDIEMKWLAVSPTATGRGIGSALVNAVLESASTERRIFLFTATTDSVIPGTAFDGSAFANTIRFFERLGFRRVGLLRDFWGQHNHALSLEREL